MISRHDTRRPPAAGHVAGPVAATGSAASGPVASGPVASGPAAAGLAVASGPAAAGPVAAAGPAPERCERGGLDAVINGSDLITATTHFGQCTACQREFLSLGGLLRPPVRPAAQSQAASVRPTEAAEPAIRIS